MQKILAVYFQFILYFLKQIISYSKITFESVYWNSLDAFKPSQSIRARVKLFII